MTIVSVALVGAIFNVDSKYSELVASALSVGYQLYLIFFGGEDFIINSPRDNLFSKNREGILGCLG
jgi:hypothetical protein